MDKLLSLTSEKLHSCVFNCNLRMFDSLINWCIDATGLAVLGPEPAYNRTLPPSAVSDRSPYAAYTYGGHSVDSASYDDRLSATTTRGMAAYSGGAKSPSFTQRSCFGSKDSGVYSAKAGSTESYLMASVERDGGTRGVVIPSAEEMQLRHHQTGMMSSLANGHAVTPAMPILGAVTQRSRDFLRSVGSRPLSEELSNLQIGGMYIT